MKCAEVTHRNELLCLLLKTLPMIIAALGLFCSKAFWEICVNQLLGSAHRQIRATNQYDNNKLLMPMHPTFRCFIRRSVHFYVSYWLSVGCSWLARVGSRNSRDRLSYSLGRSEYLSIGRSEQLRNTKATSSYLSRCLFTSRFLRRYSLLRTLIANIGILRSLQF